LAASLGVAAVSYVACNSSTTETTGNLLPPPDAASDAPNDAQPDGFALDALVANLIAPPTGGFGGGAGTAGGGAGTSGGAGGG